MTFDQLKVFIFLESTNVSRVKPLEATTAVEYSLSAIHCIFLISSVPTDPGIAIDACSTVSGTSDCV